MWLILLVVLIDEGKSDLDLSILCEFLFFLSIVVNLVVFNVVECVWMFCFMGLEVFVVLDLLEGVKFEDVEVNLVIGFVNLFEIVVIFEGVMIGL